MHMWIQSLDGEAYPHLLPRKNGGKEETVLRGGNIKLERPHTDQKRTKCSNKVDDLGGSPRPVFAC
jgi:hypothetical protein